MAAKPKLSSTRPSRSANGLEKSLRDLQSPTVRFNCDMDFELHKALKLYSVTKDKDMKELVTEWITEKLQADDALPKNFASTSNE